MPAVVAALKLDDFLAPGHRSRQADSLVCRLAARVAKKHLFGRGHVVADLFRELDFQFRRAVAHEIDLLHHATDALVHGFVVVAQHDGTKRRVVVEVIVAVRIRNHRPLGAGENELRPASS